MDGIFVVEMSKKSIVVLDYFHLYKCFSRESLGIALPWNDLLIRIK